MQSNRNNSLESISINNWRWAYFLDKTIKNFSIGEELIPIELIYSLTLIKKAASIANFNLG